VSRQQAPVVEAAAAALEVPLVLLLLAAVTNKAQDTQIHTRCLCLQSTVLCR
jgi:hypothetical protein